MRRTLKDQSRPERSEDCGIDPLLDEGATPRSAPMGIESEQPARAVEQERQNHTLKAKKR